MKYELFEESFAKTFSIPIEEIRNDKQLKHSSGNRIRFFPFKTNLDMPTVKQILGAYLCNFEEYFPVLNDSKEYINGLLKKVEFDGTDADVFCHTIKRLYFDECGDEYQLKPKNIEFISTVGCDNKYRKVSDYLASVLGNYETLKKIVEQERDNQMKKGNVLEKFLVENLTSQKNDVPFVPYYFKVINYLDDYFDSDFEFILSSKELTKDYFEELISFYYLIYTMQTSLQLNRFMDGSRTEPAPVYFCLEWEKTNQNRNCYKRGWHSIRPGLDRMFMHVNVLELLNQTDDEKQYDYIKFNELIRDGVLVDSEVASQIERIADLYIMHIPDCKIELEKIQRPSKQETTDRWIRYLFDCVSKQFEEKRDAPVTRYCKSFTDFAKNFLQARGRSGDMLSISEDRLIFLTRLCIKNKEKMRLNDVFREFENRGVFFDSTSKEHIMDFYEKLNLIEKKSDSGDAQYVKRIL